MWGLLAAWGVVGVSPFVSDSVGVDVSRHRPESSLGGGVGGVGGDKSRDPIERGSKV